MCHPMMIVVYAVTTVHTFYVVLTVSQSLCTRVMGCIVCFAQQASVLSNFVAIA